jgi:NhaP-type Na+/H+ or K+/H+ antiporter
LKNARFRPYPNGLIIESGLNDGAVMPLFIFVVALEAVRKTEQTLGTFLAIALEQIGFGIFVGIIIRPCGRMVIQQSL